MDLTQYFQKNPLDLSVAQVEKLKEHYLNKNYYEFNCIALEAGINDGEIDYMDSETAADFCQAQIGDYYHRQSYENFEKISQEAIETIKARKPLSAEVNENFSPHGAFVNYQENHKNMVFVNQALIDIVRNYDAGNKICVLINRGPKDPELQFFGNDEQLAQEIIRACELEFKLVLNVNGRPTPSDRERE